MQSLSLIEFTFRKPSDIYRAGDTWDISIIMIILLSFVTESEIENDNKMEEQKLE